MATPKKSSVKKPVTTKATPKKSATATHKTASKKVAHHTTKKSATAAGKHHRYVSLALVPDDKPFLTFRVTRQSLYWLIFSVTILGLSIWVLNLNLQVVSLYDQIDSNNAQTSLAVPAHHTATKK